MKWIGYKALPLVALLVFAAGCRRQPRNAGYLRMQEYRPLAPDTPFSLLSGAPVILVGLVLSVMERVGDIHPSVFTREPMALYRVKVRIENVLQGDIEGTEATIYFFRLLGTYAGINRMSFKVGDRFIFFLQNDHGGWRTVCDTYEYCVERVKTGPHPAVRRDRKRPINDDILEILLTRGVGVDDEHMVQALLDPRPQTGYRWGAERYTQQLSEVARQETAPVRAVACEQLKRLHKPCD